MNTLRWGIVGCGNVAEYKGGPALYQADNSALTAVMSRNKQRAVGFAQRHGVERFYTIFEDLLADPNVDAVYIATPPHVHAVQTLACAAAGKHVLCEKPMGLSLIECDTMIRETDEANIQLMIAYYRRKYPAVLKIKELLQNGAVGQPTHIRTQVISPFQKPTDGQEFWRVDPTRAGGGFLWDIGSHRIDLMIHLMGNVVDVTAFVDSTNPEIEVDDSTSLILRFQNGAQGIGIYYWGSSCGSDVIEVGGKEGRIVCDMSNGNVELVTQSRKDTWLLPPPKITHLGIVENFVQAVQGKTENYITGWEGRKTNAVLAAAMQSSWERKTVSLSNQE